MTTTPVLLTPQEVADMTRCSVSLVYANLKDGRLPGLRVGARGRGKWLVEEAAVRAWLDRCKAAGWGGGDDALSVIR